MEKIIFFVTLLFTGCYLNFRFELFIKNLLLMIDSLFHSFIRTGKIYICGVAAINPAKCCVMVFLNF